MTQTKEHQYNHAELDKLIAECLKKLEFCIKCKIQLETIQNPEIEIMREKLIKLEKQNQKYKTLLDNYINT